MIRNHDARVARTIHPLSRRQLLQVGGIGLLGLGLPDLLRAAASGPSRGGAARARSCIFIVQDGGASHIDTLDLKPEAPEEVRGLYKPIATSVPGIQICEMLPRLARLAHHYCLIRSLTHRNGLHTTAMDTCLTGHPRPSDNTPAIGAVLAKLRPASGNLPSYVMLQNLAHSGVRCHGGGFLGRLYDPLRVGHNTDNPSNPAFRFTAFDPPEDVSTDRLLQRQRLLAGLAGRDKAVAQAPAAASMAKFQEQAVELATGSEARQAFDLTQESAATRDRYGRGPLGQNLLLARRLVEAGVRLVSVNAWTGVPPGEKFVNVQTWDMHSQVTPRKGRIYGIGAFALGWALPRLDEALSALLEDLDQRGLLETTLVVLVGEFGRTPKLNPGGGRDHYPTCYSALLAGGGIQGGRVYGTSDQQAAFVKDNPVSPENFGATLFHALDVPPATRLSADGATQPVSIGTPIKALFS